MGDILPCPFCGVQMEDFHGHSFAHPLVENRDDACILSGLSFSYTHSRWGTDERPRWNRRAMFATACEERNAAEAEAAALRERVARLEVALADMPKAVLRTTICQGPAWPDDRPGVWLAALEACANSVQQAVDAALTDGGKDG